MNYQKITTNSDFKRAYYRGKAYTAPYFVIYVRKNRLNEKRIGITVGKKIGCAVKRNRAKRIMSAAVYGAGEYLKNGFDYVFVLRSRILDVKSYTVQEKLEEVLKGM